jgi:hypothetical protein
MRSYKPGEMNRSEDIKIFILNQFSNHGDRKSVGDVFEKTKTEFDISSWRFFEFLGDLEKKKYLAHETVKSDEWTVSVLRRL